MAMLYYRSRSLPVKKTPNKHDPAPMFQLAWIHFGLASLDW
jgi:hypothetical protein